MKKICLMLFLFAAVITSALFVSCNYISNTAESSSANGQTESSSTEEQTGDSSVTEDCVHVYGDWFITTQATCTEKGERYRTCTLCGYVDTEQIDELPHEYAATNVVNPTCTQQGYTTYECINCKESYTGDYVEPTEHNYIPEVTPSTCEKYGYTTYICNACGDSYTQNLTELADHIFGEWETTKEPTCLVNGLDTRVCTVCGLNDTRNTDKLAHNYVDEVIDPTCTEDGYTLHTCSMCGDYYQDNQTNKLGHSYALINEVSSTCIVKGYCEYECSRCGDINKEENAELAAHTYGDWEIIKDATCTDNGAKIRYCLVCKDDYEYQVIDKLGHDYTDKITAPTCEHGGYTTYTCATCGDTYTADETNKLEHNYTPFTVDPTCTEKGYSYYRCGNCGDTYEDTESYADALGHDYVAGTHMESTSVDESGYTCYTCSRCSDAYTESDGVYLYTPELLFEKSVVGTYYVVKGFPADCDTTVTNVYIPSYYDGLPVKEIAASAFSGNTTIKYVKIGATVEVIGEQAFHSCSALVSVNIPKSLTTFGEKAFYNCTALEVIFYEAIRANDVETLNLFAKAGKDSDSLNVYISAKVQRIPANLFNIEKKGNDIYITSIIFEENSICTEIGGSAFTKLTNLTLLVLSSVKILGDNSVFGKIGSTTDTDVYFQGTESDWNSVDYLKNSSLADNCTVYYYSESEPDFKEYSYFWHYVDGNITIWTENS